MRRPRWTGLFVQLLFSLTGAIIGATVHCDSVRLENASMRSAEGELIASFSRHYWLCAGRAYPRVYCNGCTAVEVDGEPPRTARSVTLTGASMFVDAELFAIYNAETNRWALRPGGALCRALLLYRTRRRET